MGTYDPSPTSSDITIDIGVSSGACNAGWVFRHPSSDAKTGCGSGSDSVVIMTDGIPELGVSGNVPGSRLSADLASSE